MKKRRHFNPSELEQVILEDSDWMLEHGEHPENIAPRLRATRPEVTNKMLHSVWKRTGNTSRAFMFKTLADREKAIEEDS